MVMFSIGMGIVFGLLAAASAFVITWHEYEKHNFKGKRLFLEAFQSALFVFAVFFILSLVAVFLVMRFVVT